MVAVRHFSCFQVSRISYQERFISHRFTICWILIRSVHVFEKQGLCCGLKRIWTFHSPPNYKLIAYTNVATSLSIVQTLYHLVGNTVHTTSTYDPLLMQHFLTDLDDMKVLTTTRFFLIYSEQKHLFTIWQFCLYFKTSTWTSTNVCAIGGGINEYWCNIMATAVVSYISRRIDHPKMLLLDKVLYDKSSFYLGWIHIRPR